MITFTTEYRPDMTIVSFDTSGAVVPEELGQTHPPAVAGTKGVVLSGRGPVWLYAFLTHHYHPTLWVATFDPRLGGAVVVESHGGPAVGTVVPVPGLGGT